ncbi:MAG: hypothetical protein NTV44_03460 [Firmicutes bacterium]|nr:hypothetical protein [Bacillota bacterium]
MENQSMAPFALKIKNNLLVVILFALAIVGIAACYFPIYQIITASPIYDVHLVRIGTLETFEYFTFFESLFDSGFLIVGNILIAIGFLPLVGALLLGPLFFITPNKEMTKYFLFAVFGGIGSIGAICLLIPRILSLWGLIPLAASAAIIVLATLKIRSFGNAPVAAK